MCIRDSLRGVPVSVVEGHEEHAVADVGDPEPAAYGAPGRCGLHHVALLHPVSGRLGRGELDPHVGGCGVQLGDASGLRAGVEVVESTSGGELEGILRGRGFVRRKVLGRLDHRLSLRIRPLVLDPGRGGSRDDVLSVAFAQRGVGPHEPLGVKAFRSSGRGGRAGPLDAAGLPESLIGEAGVVAGPSGAALLPRFEGGFGVVPGHEWSSVPVVKFHAPGVVEKDVEVGARPAGRLDGFLRQMDCAVGVGAGAGLLCPRRRREHHIGELRGLGQENVLDDGEEALVPQKGTDTGEFGQGDGRVGPADPEHPQRSLFGVAEHLHGMRGRSEMRNGGRVDVPHLGEFGDVVVVLPVAEARQISVGTALPGVLRRGLAVHLQHSRARPADHAAHQVQIVDLYRGGGRLVGLVEALEHCGHQPTCCAEDLRSFSDRFGRHVADV